MTKPNTNDWKKELDEQFFDYWHPVFIGTNEGQREYLKSFISAQIQKALAEKIKEIEGLRGKLICDGDSGCGQKPPFIPRQEATCGSSFGKHLALVSKYEAFSQVLEILKR